MIHKDYLLGNDQIATIEALVDMLEKYLRLQLKMLLEKNYDHQQPTKKKQVKILIKRKKL